MSAYSGEKGARLSVLLFQHYNTDKCLSAWKFKLLLVVNVPFFAYFYVFGDSFNTPGAPVQAPV